MLEKINPHKERAATFTQKKKDAKAKPKNEELAARVDAIEEYLGLK
jgi:hypothetical protein